MTSEARSSELSAVTDVRPLVVVADDEEDILTLVSFGLRRAGYDVLPAADGQEALDLIRERRPSLAVLDVKMPKLTGIDVVRELRSIDSVRGTPVILLSAGVQEDTVARGFEAGADEYIRKPFSPEELVGRVRDLIDSPPRRGA
jgi:DNA-binding response OmpR family regulator